MQSQLIDNIFEIIDKGVEQGIGQLYTEDQFYESTLITFGGKKHVNFGSYSYLSLEQDNRLKEAAIDAIQRYGIQYPSSRTYVSTTLYTELEKLIQEIFNQPIVLCTTTTLAHIATMPIVISEGDVILMDQQVHSSVQFMISNLKQNGIPVHIIRHNNMEHLEAKIMELSILHKRVWYMCDGVYSMYGDTAPVECLAQLLKKYKKFNLYVDDAHGMSWAGENGRGYFLSKMNFHERLVLVTSLNKAFAAGGAVVVLNNEKLSHKVRTCGGPLIFAGQHQMSSLGAAVKCAEIHLSNEIVTLQNELIEKIHFCHNLLEAAGLPVISTGETPIFFVGVGLPKVGYNLVKKMMDSGMYVNLAIFPAVSETCTGIRFTIIHTHSLEEIENMVNALKSNFELALMEENRTLEDIWRAFRKVKTFAHANSKSITKKNNPFTVQHETSINAINEQLWNNLLGHISTFDWAGLKSLEKIFVNNEAHNNWEFHYFLIRDESKKVVFAAYTTICISKDDALAEASISFEIEELRINDPYYLCSKCLMLGCPISIGKHFYIDQSTDQKVLFSYFLDILSQLKEQEEVSIINLRDFDNNDNETSDFITNQGFIKAVMPSNYISYGLRDINSIQDYLKTLKSSQRNFITKRSLKNEHRFLVEPITQIKNGEVAALYRLYNNVKKRSFELNLFEYPTLLFQKAIYDPNWDVVGLRTNDQHKTLIGMSCNYVNAGVYNFVLVGIDYNYLIEMDTYSQILYQVVKRAIFFKCKSINFGMTTGQNKRKFGAIEQEICAFVQFSDHFNTSVIQLIAQDNNLAFKHKRNLAKEVIEC